MTRTRLTVLLSAVMKCPVTLVLVDADVLSIYSPAFVNGLGTPSFVIKPLPRHRMMPVMSPSPSRLSVRHFTFCLNSLLRAHVSTTSDRRTMQPSASMSAGSRTAPHGPRADGGFPSSAHSPLPAQPALRQTRLRPHGTWKSSRQSTEPSRSVRQTSMLKIRNSSGRRSEHIWSLTKKATNNNSDWFVSMVVQSPSPVACGLR